MICEECQGKGFVHWSTVVDVDARVVYARKFEVCPECQGTGIAYCCDCAGANPPNVDHHPIDEALEEKRTRIERSIFSAP